jgi:(4-(4-[2-(gamma-L-glutamylamino)ethyl]phenoxymethyl)furan-2-yl)methanamine synthase
MPPRTIGLDIGGANLKAAHSDQTAFSQPFPLWKQPEQLPAAIKKIVDIMPPADHVAATMTGELCDCFASKEHGVRHILESLATALPGRSLYLWRNDARFVAISNIQDDFLPLAAANWLALAQFVGRLAPQENALLIDMGSTTTDIIPIIAGRPKPEGRTDLDRIRSGELVYVGASRTPLCALLGTPFAAEWFATTQDVYLLLGMSEENPQDRGTADGRPATREFARARIARMLCADADQLGEGKTLEIATQADKALRRAVRVALTRVTARLPGPVQTLVISGSGEFLIEAIAAEAFSPLPQVISFRSEFGVPLSSCACAFALAKLAQEFLNEAGQD